MDELIKIILLADDDDDDTELFCEALFEVDPGVTCTCVRDGKEVLEVLSNMKESLPDIIFLDVNMPGMNGWECLTRLKEEEAFRLIPVVMYSTSSLQRNANEALELGAVGFFIKPNDFKQLKTLLQAITTSSHNSLLNSISQVPGITSKRTTSPS